jgi:transposase
MHASLELIVHHEVTNVGTDRAQLASTATAAKEVLGVDKLEAVADRGYFNGEDIKACDDAGITVTLPKPMTSSAKSAGRFGKQDFVYKPQEDWVTSRRAAVAGTLARNN